MFYIFVKLLDLKYGDVVMFISDDVKNPTLLINISSVDKDEIIDINSNRYFTDEIEETYNKAYILNRCENETK